MAVPDLVLRKAEEGKRESKSLDFKSSFDPSQSSEFCELIKDVVAMANSGGGVIVLGVLNDGSPSHSDLTAVAAIDSSHFGNLIHKYTESGFADVEIHPVQRGRNPVIAIRVGPSDYPLVFCQAGTYADPNNPGKQRTAFAKGTVFFRHGAKSEPGLTEDIRASFERRLEAARRDIMRNVQMAASAPQGSMIQVFPPGVVQDMRPDGMAVRLSTDPTAPAIGVIDYDKTHPYRQKHLVEAVAQLLPKGIEFGTYDVLAVRSAHGLDSSAAFCHVFAYGGRQYSQEFAIWIVEQWKADNAFFVKARAAYLAYTRSKGWTAGRRTKRAMKRK